MIVKVEDTTKLFTPLSIKIIIQTQKEFDNLFKLSLTNIGIPDAIARGCAETDKEIITLFLQDLYIALTPYRE